MATNHGASKRGELRIRDPENLDKAFILVYKDIDFMLGKCISQTFEAIFVVNVVIRIVYRGICSARVSVSLHNGYLAKAVCNHEQVNNGRLRLHICERESRKAVCAWSFDVQLYTLIYCIDLLLGSWNMIPPHSRILPEQTNPFSKSAHAPNCR